MVVGCQISVYWRVKDFTGLKCILRQRGVYENSGSLFADVTRSPTNWFLRIPSCL